MRELTRQKRHSKTSHDTHEEPKTQHCAGFFWTTTRLMPAMNIHFVMHNAFEAPGAYETWVRARGHTASYSRVYAGEELPSSIDFIDMLVVLGGSQNPLTSEAECPYFNATAEKLLISKCVQANKAVVGVCLGAQLIGEALGAAYEVSPEKEIGSFPITLTSAGRNNKKFTHFGDSLEVGHWHNDMPGLTDNATLIASSEGCPRQIVEYTEIVYGFQCHMEFNRNVIELLIRDSGEDFSGERPRFVQAPHVLRSNSYDEMNENLFVFLDLLLESYEAKTLKNRAMNSRLD